VGLAFPFVATHNHFVRENEFVVNGRTAPVVKFPGGITESALLGLLGILNSSLCCFWLKQLCHDKGAGGIAGGLATETWERRHEFATSVIEGVPLPKDRPSELARSIELLAIQRRDLLPSFLVREFAPTRESLSVARKQSENLLERLIALQEELDWLCYQLYQITDRNTSCVLSEQHWSEPPHIRLGERAFEIVLARRIAGGDEESTWFSRHGSKPITHVPNHWPREYRELVERRIALIENDRQVALMERPEYKRRWNVESWEELERKALANWLLDRLETPTYWPNVAFQTTRDLADRAALDPDFQQVAALYAGEGVALEPVIRELILGEAVPFLPALRYTESGREKRHVWERTWELQRREDAIDADVAAESAFAAPREGESAEGLAKRLAAAQKARREAEVGTIARPPKYTSADFQRAEYWRMRGALDVPKERFILYPFCGRDGDNAPLLGWAGWNHLQQAQALTEWYADRTQSDGWRGERVIPMLAGMAELVPWLLQWHNELDPELGDRPGDVYASWLSEELHTHGLTAAALDDWEPPQGSRGSGRRASAKRATRSRKQTNESDDAAEAAE